MTATDEPSLMPLIVADAYELAGRLRERGEEIARSVGQTQARWQVMSAASVAPRTVPQIARRLGVSRQNVQRIADALVRENWARFEPNPDHRGSPFLVLGERGRLALVEITRAARAFHVAFAANFTREELEAIHRGLRLMLAATLKLKESRDE